MITEVKEISRNSHKVYLESAADEEYFLYVPGDIHLDHTQCDRELLDRHLQEAREKNAIMVAPGDLFDVMQAPGDRRASKSALRDDHKRDDYFNAVVEEAAEWLAPRIKDLPLFIIGLGNHETAVTKYHGIDLTRMLAHRLREVNPNVYAGGYGGWLTLHYQHKDGKGGRGSVKLKYYHGKEMGIISKGIQGVGRRAGQFSGAHIIVSGHTHDEFITSEQMETCRDSGRIEQFTHLHVQVPSYKDDYEDGYAGFAVEKLKPKPLGGAMIRLRFRVKDGRYQPLYTAEPMH